MMILFSGKQSDIEIMSKKIRKKKQKWEGHSTAVDRLIGTEKGMCDAISLLTSSHTRWSIFSIWWYVYMYIHIELLMLFLFLLLLVDAYSQLRMSRAVTMLCFRSVSMWLCNHINVYIHAHTHVHLRIEQAKARYLNHHYEQMFFGLLVIIFISAHIPDGSMGERGMLEGIGNKEYEWAQDRKEEW
jgi:hypothetical protein